MSNIIRTIKRNSVLLSERFEKEFAERAKLTASLAAGKAGRRRTEGLIYPQQGQEFNTSPTAPLKEYQKNQPPKKRHSWIPAIVKKSGILYRKYSNGKIHQITTTGAQICAPEGFRI